MRKNKYDIMAPVVWRDVLKCLEWALVVRKHEAQRLIDEVERDVKHNYPERLESHVNSALGVCERVFFHFELLNSLRLFLNYKAKRPCDLNIQGCYDFYFLYNGKSPSSCDLAASTTRGLWDSE